MVYRVYVEKKPPFAQEAAVLKEQLEKGLGIRGLRSLRILHRYDVEGIERELFEACIPLVFSEPPVDDVVSALHVTDLVFAVEYLPGQFDQRADSAAECIQLISQQRRPMVSSAKVYCISGRINPDSAQKIQNYIVNPVESRLASLELPNTLALDHPTPPDVPVLEGFRALANDALPGFAVQYSLAMDVADLACCRAYFAEQKRDPTLTELRVIDTYWSDHCRHTTFETRLDTVTILDEKANKTYNRYLEQRKQLSRTKPISLMDLGTIGAKVLKQSGKLPQLDESDEVNACSVRVQVDRDGKLEDWLLLYKNETHNHPTEIEPFGGAATCIGGAIRDPLANRGYVFGAMRVTGAANPLQPIEETLPGKLPQRKIVQTAAKGYSSYGNQVGLATGLVQEIYHPDYLAKRMEVGAVLGAVPLAQVRRERPQPGDLVLLLGGRTGRDGCGGATGSSKAHSAGSLVSCGAEVQKGNPPMERKLQRLFRNPEAAVLIKRCNDFGAGGVSVAIGELADSLRIDLDGVPKKYEGLDGTELAISESQERMAIVVDAKDEAAIIALADAENLEATRVAVVTEEPRLVMTWRGQPIVDIDRRFLDTNGAARYADVCIEAMEAPVMAPPPGQTVTEKLRNLMSDLRFCSQKGLGEMFDATIGAASVLLPFGGRYQASPADALAMKFPVEGQTNSCAGMAWGFDPTISEQNPYEGARLAVMHSVAKLAACGFSRGEMTLSFQEYFPRLGTDPKRWAQPVAALLGALEAQMGLGVAAIGGKDSMSGSYEQLDVPPTLISFAVAPGRADAVVSPQFEVPFSPVALLRPMGEALVPSEAAFRLVLTRLEKLFAEKKVLSCRALGAGGLAQGLFLITLGNRLGVRLNRTFDEIDLFGPAFGGFLLELAEPVEGLDIIGETTRRYELADGVQRIPLEDIQRAYEATLEPVFPTKTAPQGEDAPTLTVKPARAEKPPAILTTKPRALIPVFPGTNCEYDAAAALQKVGAQPEIFILRNRGQEQVAQSAAALAQKLEQSQMLVLPGGFSGGDEPEGSAKLIAAFLRGPAVAEALTRLLDLRGGLVLGICNGFQALIKLGLVPYGRITQPGENSPTLTFNTIGRHQSRMVRTRVASSLSPWLAHEPVGALHTVAVSHGEGRFIAEKELLQRLADAGQIATQYVDFEGKASMDIAHNPNGSLWAVEGLTSPDGRVLGKMGHTERKNSNLYVNVAGNTDQKLFESGVDYFG